MKRTTPLFLLFSLTLTFTAFAFAKPTQADAIETFWQKFSAAVRSNKRSAVAALTRFPVGMSYGIRSIKTRAELMRRYRQVFNEQTDAAKCFEKAKPEKDAQNPKEFSVACPDAAGNEVVIYHFRQTKMGWRFVALDNINE
ncbi:MAG TPA: hypothetical protein VF779_10845 [Pyrinomonadaceae bacterium]